MREDTTWPQQGHNTLLMSSEDQNLGTKKNERDREKERKKM